MSGRYRFLPLLLALVLLIPAQRSFARDIYINGCDIRVIGNIDATTPLDYEGGCKAYRECLRQTPIDYAPCQMSAWAFLHVGCEADDPTCPTTALLYATAMPLLSQVPTSAHPDWGLNYMFATPPTETPDDAARRLSIENVTAALKAFQETRYEDALAIFSRLQTNDADKLHLLAFMRAEIYETMGDDQHALEGFTEAQESSPLDPFVRYALAGLHGALGEVSTAVFETEWLRQYAEGQPEWQPIIAPLLERFPLDTTQLETWMLYPMIEHTYGSGGNVDIDRTLDAPYPIQLAYPTNDAIYMFGFSGESDCGAGCVDSALLIQDDDGTEYAGQHENYFHVTLARSGENFSGSATWRWCIDSCATITFVLTPLGAPDPRADLPGERCGVLSRLEVGMTAENAMSPGYSLYDGPDGKWYSDGEDSPFGRYWFNGYFWKAIIVGGGICIDDVRWWQVETESGEVGWTQENWSRQYALNPTANVRIWSGEAP